MRVSKGTKDRRYSIVFGLAALVVLLDQLTKLRVMQLIPLHSGVPVVENFFDLVHIRNRGAAFGFLNSPDIEWQFWLFLAATLVAAGAVISLTRSATRPDRILFCGLGLVFGGAVGNLIDRMRFRAVVDFLDFHLGEWHWPAFNAADVAICCGAALACLSFFRGDRADKAGPTASDRSC